VYFGAPVPTGPSLALGLFRQDDASRVNIEIVNPRRNLITSY